MERIGNPKNLPTVLTCYSSYELSKFVGEGHKVVVLPISENPVFRTNNLLLRHRETSVFLAVPSRQISRQYDLEVREYSEDEWELIYEGTKYWRPRKPNDGWGAYVLPKEIQDGQRVYVADVLEDIVATYFHQAALPAEDGEGIWDGSKITIDMKPYDKIIMIG